MAKHVLIALLALGASFLVGCGASGPEKVDSMEDIVGTWQRVGGGAEAVGQGIEEGSIEWQRIR